MTELLRYNTLVVLAGSALLGSCAGMVGSFAVLRRRALMGDALAHAALPGLCVAFLVVGQKSLPALLAGALVSGVLGIAVVSALRRYTRIKEDAAIGIVLSVFFGAGIVISRMIQNRSDLGSKAGLDSYILGKTAGMTLADVYFIAAMSAGCLVAVLLLYKEFKLMSFDPQFASAQGWPVVALDLLLMGLVAVMVVVGLPAVGVVLIAALLIVPGAAARFWTDRLGVMLAVSAGLGLAIGVVGTAVSARYSGLPAGPIIVLVGSAMFLLSMLLAPRRGLVARAISQRRFEHELAERNLLRVLYEESEVELPHLPLVPLRDLVAERAWTTEQLMALLDELASEELVTREPDGCRLTSRGLRRAAAITRGHRLWQAYLTHYADAATATANLASESIEDVLPEPIVRELTEQLRSEGRLPASSGTVERAAP